MRWFGKLTVLDFADITANCRLYTGLILHEIFRELRFFTVGHIQYVVQYQDLTIDIGACPYAYDRDFQYFCNTRSEAGWYAFQQ